MNKNIMPFYLLILSVVSFAFAENTSLKYEGNKLFKNVAYFDSFDLHKDEWNKIINKIEYLKDTIIISVIYRDIPQFYCGFFSSASITVGIKNKRDTVTIISLCDRDSLINIKDLLMVFPTCSADTIKFNIDFIGKNINNTMKYIREYKSYYCNRIIKLKNK